MRRHQRALSVSSVNMVDVDARALSPALQHQLDKHFDYVPIRTHTYCDGHAHCVVINPLLVATIQRLPHNTIESILPSPGTRSPRAAFQMPPGPSKMAVPSTTFRNVQPLMVAGLLSGTGTSLDKTLARRFFRCGL